MVQPFSDPEWLAYVAPWHGRSLIEQLEDEVLYTPIEDEVAYGEARAVTEFIAYDVPV